MSRNALNVKGLPQGWRILQMARSSNEPRDAYILCEREPHSESDMNFVTWYANLVEGGCHGGNYTDSLEKATADFNRRKAGLR